MGSGVTRTVSGSYEGTGTAQSIQLDKVGFKPKRVSVYRMDTQQDLAEHIEGMADDSMLLTDGSTGARSLVTTAAITLTETGFSLGTNAGVNNNGDTYRYFAEE